MALFFNKGGFVVNTGVINPSICVKAVFQDTINLKAIWVKCDE